MPHSNRKRNLHSGVTFLILIFLVFGGIAGTTVLTSHADFNNYFWWGNANTAASRGFPNGGWHGGWYGGTSGATLPTSTSTTIVSSPTASSPVAVLPSPTLASPSPTAASPLPTAVLSPSAIATNSGTDKNALDATASDANWSMIWSDDFTGPTVDTSKWTVSNYPAGLYNDEQECYKNDGVHTRIEGSGGSSHLVIEADNQTNDSACPYISGRMDTYNKYFVPPPTSGKPVRVEASIQLPVGGKGIWPAFWMLGQNGGEVDIMENVSQLSMSTIQSTVHGTNNVMSHQLETLPSGTYSDGYHLMAMDWYTDHMVFSVDGRASAPIDTTQLGNSQLFNQPYYIVLNVAVGGNWPGNADSTTPFPQQMNVAFVRVYQHV